MKLLCATFLMFFGSLLYSQENYPVPTKTDNRLFYIQHSNNFNTYVYDALLNNHAINAANPLDIYRIIYTRGGIRKPLTSIQKSMAYGMETKQLSAQLFELKFAASNALKLYLTLDDNKPKVYVTINGEKIWLDRIFIKLNDGSGLSIKADYVLFYGKSFKSNTNVVLKQDTL